MPTPIPWPDSLPAPVRDQFGYTMAATNQRTDFPIGARMRQLYTDGLEPFDRMTLLLTRAEWAYFQAWYRYTLANGTKWFLMPLAAAGLYTDFEVRMVSPPKPIVLSAAFAEIALMVETRQGTTMDAATWNLVQLYADTDGFTAMMQALEIAINEDLAGL